MSKSTNKNKSASQETTLDVVEQGIAKLFNAHTQEFRKILDESEEKCVTLNFKVDMDESGTNPKMRIGLRFSQSVTDNVQYTLDDPKQGKFTEIIAQVEEAKVGSEPDEKEPEKE